MKTKTIKKELSKIRGRWLATIKDKDLKELIRKDMIVTGGSIASMLLGEEVNDYDIYFSTAKAVNEVAKYYLAAIKKISKVNETSRIHYFKGQDQVACTEEEFVKSKTGRLKIFVSSSGYIKVNATKLKFFEPIFASSNAIMLKGKLQLVLRFWGPPEKIHENYDFVHCLSYWHKNELIIPQETAVALLTRELIYQGSKYPLTSIIRTRKFIRKGWKITAGEFLKMAVQLQEIDLFNPAVLEDQLMGVDVSYFETFIYRMKKAMKEPGFKIDSSYLIELVDEIFNGDHEMIEGEQEDE